MNKKATVEIQGKDSGASSMLSKLDKSVEGLANKVKNCNIGQLSYQFNNITTTAGKLVDATKAVAAVVNDLTATYKVQAKAETQLEAAARNNPYLSRMSVENLKKYAGELQSISIYGDEQLLPYMGELAAAGRTEKEIMDVMSAAIDVAASGTMDLGSAVKALNATYNGTAGTLGKTVTGVKNLTQEELKNGEAVKLVANQYKGMAEQTAKATGAAEQLKNAWGDVKELIGGFFEGVIGPVQKGLATILGQLTGIAAKVKQAEATKRLLEDAADPETGKLMDLKDLKDAQDEASKQKTRAILKDTQIGPYEEALKKRAQAYEKMQNPMILIGSDEYRQAEDDARQAAVAMNNILNLIPEFGALTQADIPALKNTLRQERELAEETYDSISETYAQKAAEKWTADRKAEQEALKAEQEAAEAELKAKRDANNKIIDDAKEAYQSQLDALDNRIQLEKDLYGKQVTSQEDVNREKLKIMESGLLVAEKSMGSLWNLPSVQSWYQEQVTAYKKILKTLPGENGDAPELSAEDKKKLESLQKEIMGILEPDDPNKKMSQILAERIAMLEKYYKEVMQMQNLSDEQRQELARQYYLSLEKLDDQRKAAEAAEEAQAKKAARDKMIADWQDRLSIAQEFSSKFSEIVSTLTDAALEASQAESKARLKQVENEYEQGLISETEYEEKSKEIRKKAADEEYRLRLWQWGAQIAQITIDTAQAVMSAMTQPGNPLVNIAMASLVGAMGAAQLGTAMAQKPQPPSFAHGGIVPGNSWSGDNVSANVNSGEMILTRAQQADLWRSISGGIGAGGWNVAVNNYMGGRADVSTRRTPDGLVLDIIDAHINQGMARGTYDAGMAGYSVSQKGVTIL